MKQAIFVCCQYRILKHLLLSDMNNIGLAFSALLYPLQVSRSTVSIHWNVLKADTLIVCPCISRCLSQMEEDGLSVDDLFSQCLFQQDERDMVLKAIRIIQPDYKPCLNPTTDQSYSSLVQEFYTQVPWSSFEMKHDIQYNTMTVYKSFQMFAEVVNEPQKIISPVNPLMSSLLI